MNETLILSLHALPGLLALILGSIVLLSKKGTKTHKRRGYIWLGLMLLISLTAIFIQEINPGSYSLIHLISMIIYRIERLLLENHVQQ